MTHSLRGLVALVALVTPLPAGAQRATEVAQIVSLQDAARAGIVSAEAKGGISGDQVALDLTGARLPGAPVQITFHIELFGTDATGAPWTPSKAAEMKAVVEGRLAGLRAPDGTPVDFLLDVRVRGGTSAQGGTPGYHQIELIDKPYSTPFNVIYGARLPFGAARTGQVGANDADVWTHELLHLGGLKDRRLDLEPFFITPNGTRLPITPYQGDGSLASINAWANNVMFKESDRLRAEHGGGQLHGGIPPGHENDIMADGRNPDTTVWPEDLQRLVDMAGVQLHVDPGDLLLNKDGASQNFGVGAPLDLYAPRGQTVRVEGLYVYCLDFEDFIPTAGQRFDVLGPAASQPEPGMAALQRILETIALHQDFSNLEGPNGAQIAVWSITNSTDIDPSIVPEAMAFFQEAGIVWDPVAFADTPQFVDPNAAGPTTAGVTTTGVLPSIPVIAGPSPVSPNELEQPPHLAIALMTPAVVRVRKAVTLTVLVEGSADRLVIGVERRKRKRWLPVSDTLELSAPTGFSSLTLPALAKKGAYRVRVAGLVDTVELALKVKGPKRRSLVAPQPGY